MFRKRLASAILACALLFSCALVPAVAAEAPSVQVIMPRVSGSIDCKISAKSYAYMGDPFNLSAGDVIKYDCTYTPKSASVDFGVIAPDGLFYALKCTSGSIDKSLKVDQLGQYQLVIRNNESYAVTVTGTVKY